MDVIRSIQLARDRDREVAGTRPAQCQRRPGGAALQAAPLHTAGCNTGKSNTDLDDNATEKGHMCTAMRRCMNIYFIRRALRPRRVRSSTNFASANLNQLRMQTVELTTGETTEYNLGGTCNFHGGVPKHACARSSRSDDVCCKQPPRKLSGTAEIAVSEQSIS